VYDALMLCYRRKHCDADRSLARKLDSLRRLPQERLIDLLGMHGTMRTHVLEQLCALELARAFEVEGADPSAQLDAVAVEECDGFPFRKAILLLRRFTMARDASDKLACLSSVSKAAEEYFANFMESFGADELLPAFNFLWVFARVPYLLSQQAFMLRFVSDSVKFDYRGYLFTQFQVSLSYLERTEVSTTSRTSDFTTLLQELNQQTSK
jgi:Vacuolar sorting protein 9 (VPS9) domain